MSNVVSLIKCCVFVMIFSLSCFTAQANENDKEQLLFHVNQYQDLILKNKFESAAKEAENAYNFAQKLYDPSSKSYLIVAEEYALILLQIEKYKQAVPILQNIVEAIENKYSAHDERLIPLLGDLKLATKHFDKKLSQEYSVQQTRLYLRYNSNEYVEGFSQKTLNSTQQAKNLAADLSKLTNKEYAILDAGQWDLIYDKNSSFNFKQLIKQMDVSYRSALGFLISFNVLSKPPEDKLKAVFFSSREDYQTYLKSRKSQSATLAAQQSSGIYSRTLNNLYLFDRQYKNTKKNKFTVLSTLRHEIAHQLFFNLGLQSRSRNAEYPRWLTEGLATSLEFHIPSKVSGAQTENYSFRRLNNLKQRMQSEPLTSITKIVSIRLGAEGLASKHTPDIYELGGFLVKFLYEHHPDSLRKYIQYLTKTHRDKLTRRSAVFYRHFGDRESLQNEFDVYLQSLINQMEEKRKKNENENEISLFNSKVGAYYTLNSSSR